MAQIKTYARLKPSKKAYPGYEIGKNVLTVHIPDNKDFLIQGPQQAIRSNLSYDIVFTDIFRPEATQEAVFDGVAKDIIQNFLNGYNGTIFAYGQTGTGKTYTVEGNTSRYSTRGLATRALSMIYQQLENRTDEHISVYLSYLEIYQEVAYDLLNPAARSSLPVAPFAKVTVVEGPRGSCILRGLSLHLAANEEIAQMLLLQGQANRKVAETPVNQRSSRSHAVFTVYLQVRKHDSEVLVNSKLHLVDLAGSERVSKTGVDGQQLTEAKSINLSLHHLETVIIALQSDRTNTPSSSSTGERSKGDNPPTVSRSNTSFTSGPSSDGSRPFKFVPYRNSLLTMVLKDSLGGNCLTAMIATISLEPENLGESISTCRFAQRVARIANNARRNEEVDDKTLIKRLKHKVAYLENQVALLRSKGRNEPITDEDILDVLTEEDRIVCAKIMEGFLQGVITDPVDAGICDQCRFRECLHLLKHQCLQIGTAVRPPKAIPPQTQQGNETTLDQTEPVQPNNPHRDGGDHVMNTTSQGTSPTAPNLSQCPPSKNAYSAESVTHSSSEITMQSPEDYCDGGGEIIQAEGGVPRVKKSSPLDHLLDSLRRGEKTFDKKDAKTRKQGKMDEEEFIKQEQLEKLKHENLIEELTAAEHNLSLKLQVADEQVLDQHAYLMQLKQLQADPDLIAKEHLVEKHLLKRQAKFREKLNNIMINKAKLEHSQGTDVGNNANHTLSARASMEDMCGQLKQGKGALNTRQVYDMLKAEEKKQQKCITPKQDLNKLEREKMVMEPMQLAVKEAATLEKLRELKQILRMSQQQKDVDFRPGPYLDMDLPVNFFPHVSGSKENNLSSKYLPNQLLDNFDLDTDQACGQSLVPADRNGSRSKDTPPLYCSVDAPDDHVKRLQEYLDQVLNSTYIDKFVPDSREITTDCLHSREAISGNVHQKSLLQLDQPFQHSQLACSIDPIVYSVSPGNDGIMPTEVRSLHDPRHSHKFALDDRPNESSSLVTPEKNNIESLYQNNCNVNHPGKKVSRSRQHSTLGNSNNSNSAKPHLSEINSVKCAASCPRNQNASCSSKSNEESSLEGKLSVDSDLRLESNPRITTRDNLHASGKVADLEKDPNFKENTNSVTRVSNSLSDKLLELQPLSTDAGLKIKSSSIPTEGKQALVLSPSEYINSMSDTGKFDARKMGLSCRTFETALSHMLEWDDRKNVPNLPYEIDPYEKYARVSKPHSSLIHHSKNRFLSPYQEKLKVMRKLNEGKNKLASASTDQKPILKGMSKGTPEADKLFKSELRSYHQDSAALDSTQATATTGDKKINQFRMDPFQIKLAYYKTMDHFEEDEDEDSFFGLQPDRTKLTAMTSDERERTFMSAVAAEKARVNKIRKAREAAETIQRHWRKFRVRQ
ncbi:unnamed protein product [Lymnaea stagnalis]|uniref:Kinesin motor domain-containing protein n=1 Tax=Lymnaea stagnalis TaxID=6523 RepID=A0AAV2IKY0_LYMST